MIGWRKFSQCRPAKPASVLALAWAAALTLAVAGWTDAHQTMPSAGDTLVALFSMAAFALPVAGANGLGFWPGPEHLIGLSIVYWGAVTWTHNLALRRAGSRTGLMLGCVLPLMGAHRWIVVAEGLMGA